MEAFQLSFVLQSDDFIYLAVLPGNLLSFPCLCMYVRLLMCVHMRVQMGLYAFECVYMCVYVCVHMCVCVCAHVCMCVCTCVCVCVSVYRHVGMCLRMCAYVCTCTFETPLRSSSDLKHKPLNTCVLLCLIAGFSLTCDLPNPLPPHASISLAIV